MITYPESQKFITQKKTQNQTKRKVKTSTIGEKMINFYENKVNKSKQTSVFEFQKKKWIQKCNLTIFDGTNLVFPNVVFKIQKMYFEHENVAAEEIGKPELNEENNTCNFFNENFQIKEEDIFTEYDEKIKKNKLVTFNFKLI
jgi:hypothetical protein